MLNTSYTRHQKYDDKTVQTIPLQLEINKPREIILTDRFGINSRKEKILPVQNDYLQKYHMHQLQQQQHNFFVEEQTRINRIMETNKRGDQQILNRNFDSVLMNNRYPNDTMLSIPQDTRRVKHEPTNTRPPMAKNMGCPYNDDNIHLR